jgi:hypothetical protein
LKNQKVEAKKVTTQDVDAVLQYLPYFADPSTKFYDIDKGSLGEPTVINIEPFIYSPKLSEFITTLYHCNFIQEFDWTLWHDEAEKYQKYPELISGADLEIIIKLLTTHVRADRFCTGHLASMLDNGHLLQILQRLAEIRKEVFP